MYEAARLYEPFSLQPAKLHRAFTASPLKTHPVNSRGLRMADVLIIVLGTGGILLMALYAALCERI